MASARRTYDTDSIYLRRIFARDSNNNKVTPNYVLIVDSNSEGRWVDSSELVLSAGYYYLSTNIAELSNYVFTPMKYEGTQVRFTSNVVMNCNLNVAGLTTLSQLNVNGNTAVGNLTVTSNINAGGALTLANGISGVSYNKFIRFNNDNTHIGEIGGRMYVFNSNAIDFHIANSYFPSAIPSASPSFRITDTSNVSYRNLDIQGNLSFQSVSTGFFSMTYFSSGQGAIDTLDTKSFAASTISTPFINADTISVNRLYANEYNYDINQFNFKNLSAGTLVAGSISSGTIGADTISSGIITADLISAGKIELANFTVSSLYTQSFSTGLLSLDTLSAGIITAGTISTPSLLVETFNIANAGITTLTGTLASYDTLRGGRISTGYLDVTYISTPYGEFSTVSSAIYLGPLTQTTRVVATTGSFSTATFSTLTASNLSASSAFISSARLQNTQADLMLVSTLGAGFLSAGTVSIGSAYIDRLLIGRLDITAGITNNIEASTIRVSSLTASTINIPVFIGPEARFSTLKAATISTGIITGGLTATQNISVPLATIQNLTLSSGNFAYTSNALLYANALKVSSIDAQIISTPAIYADYFSTGTLEIGQFIIDELDTALVSSAQANIELLSANTATLSNLYVSSQMASLSVNTLAINNARVSDTLFTQAAQISGSLNTFAFTASNLAEFYTDINLYNGKTVKSSQPTSNASVFFSCATSNFYAENGFIKNLSFTNISFGAVNFATGNFTTLNIGTGNANIFNINTISTGIIRSRIGNYSIVNTSTLTTNTFATNNFTADVITANTISTATIQFSNVSAINAYIDTLSVGTEFVGQATFQQATTDTLIVNSNLGIATTKPPVTNLDVNGSVNVGTKWRYFIGTGRATGGDTSIKVSSDGFSWQNTTNSLATSARAALWTGKFWIAAGEDVGAGPIKYSGDGLTWNNCIFTDAGSIQITKVNGIAQINGFYMAYGEGVAQNIYVSQDGITWNPPTANNIGNMGITKVVQDPATSNIVFTMYFPGNTVPNNQTIAFAPAANVTINNINIITIINAYESAASDALWDGQKWITIGDPTLGFTSSILTSADGTHWSGVIGDFTDKDFYGRALAWNGQTYLAGAEYINNANSNTIKYSFDGYNWSNATGTLPTAATGFAWNGAYWIASVSSIQGTSFLYSKDGTAWSADGFTGSFQTLAYNVTFSGSSNYPVSTLINGPIEVLKGVVETDWAVGSNLTYGLGLRNTSTVWQTTNQFISSIENFPYVKTGSSTSVVYLRRPQFYMDTFENLVYATSTIVVSSLLGKNILSSGTWTSAYNVAESTMTKLCWTPVPGNPLWRVTA